MNYNVVNATALSAALIAGCASRASSVPPVAVSSNDYSSVSCAQAKDNLAVARAKEIALTRKQNNAATADAASVFLVLLPLGSVFGADVSGELAQAKGEVIALERHIANVCKS